MSLFITDNNFAMSIEHYGQTMKYLSGRLCSCVGDNNGRPKESCGCNLGFWYADPETIRGIRRAVQQKYNTMAQGTTYDGGCQITIPEYYAGTLQGAYKKLAHGDIIIMENKQRRDTDILRKGIRDKIFAYDIYEILSVSFLNTVYLPGIDYNVSDRTIVWLGANQPAEGVYYSVEFICNQQYKIWDNGVKDRGTDNDKLPRLVLCVLRRYVNTEDTNPMDGFSFNQDVFK